MIKKYLLLTSCLLTQFLVYGQKKYEELTKEDYLKDFDVLVDVIKQQHPNPYRFISEQDFNSSVKKLRSELEKDASYSKFLLSNPLPLIKDAHSGLSTDLMVFEDFSKTATFFPFSTVVFNEKVFVNQFNKYIPAGAIIEKVNGKSAKELLDNIRISSDGLIDVVNAKDFSLYVSLMYNGIEEYRIEYRENLEDDELKEITVNSVNYARSYYNSQKSIFPIDLISYSYGIFGQEINSETYVLTIKTFGFSEEYAYHKLSTFFEQLQSKGVKNLIIDIRGNGGGLLSNIPLYYSFISKDKMFKNTYRYATKVLDIKVRENLVDSNGRQFSEMDIKNMDNFMYQRYDEVEGEDYYYGNNRLDESYVENYPRDRKAFDGKVYLLIDNNTVSAATYFASLFKENDRGVIVGQETRTCSNFTTASWFINYKLPNTQTIVDLPRSEVFFNDKIEKSKGCRGVIPDYQITEDQFYEGLLEMEDPELKFVLKLIQKESELIGSVKK
ncbi:MULTISPECIES: S41 family peptidase [Myroides]|uniref:Peptidase S41 n=1 Tax=Myroides albus TaxID=2562892 RepID=A0A6I3LKR8_9FLAO|nr:MULTISPECIES: S41 family peptidase [Myroides]MTG98414.1 peptidase S41 [Myroides albus]MVX34516.1 peptidase S41 [Myroides sp. LoEW2-1]UVD79674.1 S41 family peptidase [Myroides albus]